MTTVWKASFASLLGAIAVLSPIHAEGGLVLEDFDYPFGALSTRNGGQGWSAPWGASTGTGGVTGRLFISNSVELTYSGGGYNVPQTGVGSAYGDFNEFRGMNRPIGDDLSGTVWFSILINNPLTSTRAGLQFNNHNDLPFTGSDYAVGPFHVEVNGQNLEARYGGVQSGPLLSLALNTTHLLLGRLTIGSGNDRLELWANPPNLLNLGAPIFDANNADLGSNLYLAGVFSYGSSTTFAKLDALRISDGNGDAVQAFQDVTGVPEPSSAVLLLSGGLLLGSRFPRRRSVA